MRPLFALLAVLSLSLVSAASPATVRVEYSNPGITPSSWTLVLHPDGSGHFTSNPGAASKTDMEVPAIDRPIQLDQAFVQKVFVVASSHTVMTGTCESHEKVAFQGWKTITYEDGGTSSSCKFNYSKDKQIQSISEALLGVATTIIEGQRLEMLLLHDPLGLDKEMGFLVDASADGRVRQICAIRTILQQLQANQSVMERVRKRAQILLIKAQKGY
ncbi:MAG: hypothetical protein KGN79_12000 [Acidobacteriota bacterium]|nr:hypothetical protein [Acidobacteriota bacterium]